MEFLDLIEDAEDYLSLENQKIQDAILKSKKLGDFGVLGFDRDAVRNLPFKNHHWRSEMQF